MKIGVVTDGKYGERAFANFREIFPTEWIQVEEIPSTTILDEYELNIPECDLYISYLRHPDQVIALAEKGKPTILGISFGPGFLKQVQKINSKVIALPTMCSLEPNTKIPEIDELARYFGRLIYKTTYTNGTISEIEGIRCSPCGSSRAGVQFIKGKVI